MIDTNVLVAASDLRRPGHAHAVRVLNESPGVGTVLYASGQILREYLCAATRPTDVNGLGFSRTDAVANVQDMRRRVQLLAETESVADRLLDLLERIPCAGRQIHDANIVATMLVHGVGTLVTGNRRHFERFAHLIEIQGLTD